LKYISASVYIVDGVCRYDVGRFVVQEDAGATDRIIKRGGGGTSSSLWNRSVRE
jgi:hypothetical protein